MNEIEITKRDGQTEKVTIHELEVEHYPNLLKAADDELVMADIFVAKNAGWSKGLTNQSIERIVIEGERINGDAFGRWMQRRFARLERVSPGATAKLLQPK